MGNILAPRPVRFRPPEGSLRLKQAHPLALGLEFCLEGHDGLDFVTGRTPTLTSVTRDVGVDSRIWTCTSAGNSQMDYGTHPGTGPLNLNGGTWCIWFRYTGAASHMQLASQSDADNDTGWNILGNTSIRFVIPGSSGDTMREAGAHVPTDVATSIFITYDGGTLSSGITFWIDGVKDTGAPANNSDGSGTRGNANTQNLLIGRSRGSGDVSADADIYGVRIYSRILNDVELYALAENRNAMLEVNRSVVYSFPGKAAGASGSAASSAPTITGAATGASLFAGAGSSSPTLTFAATGASLAAGAGSCTPALTFAATGADLSQAAGSSAPTLTFAATGASLAAGAGSSAPSLTIDATSAALKAVTGSSSPTLTFAATGASLAAGAPSCAPSITVGATGSTGGSDLSSSPTLTMGATGASLFAGAGSSSPSITVDAVGVWLAAAAGSSSPTLTFTATGASLFAAAPSCAPSITANMTSTTGSGGSCTPVLTFGATGKSLAAVTAASAPTITVGATGASLSAAAASCTPLITVNATSGGAGGSRLWRPDYGIGAQLWRPDYYPAYA